jgi:hypothetical protein
MLGALGRIEWHMQCLAIDILLEKGYNTSSGSMKMKYSWFNSYMYKPDVIILLKY